MNFQKISLLFLSASLLFSSCVSKKKYLVLKKQIETSEKSIADHAQAYKAQIDACNQSINGYKEKAESCEEERKRLAAELALAQTTVGLRSQQVEDLKVQLADAKAQRDKQFQQANSLATLSQSASNNVKETLSQLEKKDKYIHLLQAAKTQADSINLALAVNLKSVLQEGVMDNDVDIKVDKTVVFVNLSDKMLFQSGSATITSKANDVLGKIAKIVASRPDLEVMVEGYTDNVAIKTACLEDNWDLSVKRASAVVRVLQKSYGVNPNRLIAAGRGEYNALVSNDTSEGRATNRRTRIIILPKLDQFYDLLNPNNVPK